MQSAPDDADRSKLDPQLEKLVASPRERVRLLQALLGAAACRQLGIYPLPEGFKLSVVIPVFNEKQWIRELVARVLAVPIPKEIIIVDDCSTDGTRDILRELAEKGVGSLKEKTPDPFSEIRVFLQDHNQGKGAALREGFRHVTGDVVVIQDADLEYDPDEYPRLIQPIIENRADVVYGSRFIGESHRVLYFWHYVANRTLTALSNFFTNLNLTDMETCYKVFRREVLTGLKLKSNRFGFEPEITAKIAKKRQPPWRVYEIPISYSGRTYEEGKKIGLKDAFNALYCVIRYWLMD
jgi:glycosyltransferase involved in cell wall biosynthesis